MGNFSVSPLTQDGETLEKGYYQFLGKPGGNEKVSLELRNNTEKEIKVSLEANTAWTNQNGVPSYTASSEKDSSLNYLIEELINIEQETVTVPKNGKRIVPVTIKYPDSSWKGQLLGGIRVQELTQEETEKGIKNEVVYVIGVLLEMEDADTVKNEFQLNKVTVDQRNYRTYVEMNLQNLAPKIIKQMKVSASVYKENQTKAVYELQSDNFRMAPNSNFNIGVPTGDQPIASGEYRAELQVEADGEVYHFTKKFVVDKKKAADFNRSAVNIDVQDNIAIYWIVSFSVVVGIIVVYLIKKGLERRDKKM